jgi:predicted PurR-regulated permease PerM
MQNAELIWLEKGDSGRPALLALHLQWRNINKMSSRFEVKSIPTKHVPEHATVTGGNGSSPLHSMRTELWILAFLGVVGFFYFARPVILPVMLACVTAMVLRPLMEKLTKLHLPRVVSALLVMTCFMALAGVVLAQLQGPVVQWVNRAPEYGERLQKFSDRFLHPDKKPGQPASAQPAGSAPSPASSAVRPSPSAPTAPAASSKMEIDYKTILTWTGATLTEAVEVIVLLFLLLISDNWLAQRLEQILLNTKGQQWATGSISEIQRNISGYLFSISLINTVLGILVGAGLAVMHFPNAIMWGVMAALLNYIPYFGPIVGIILVGLVSVFTLDSVSMEIMPAAWYLVIHILESDIITPVLLGRRFTIHPVMILISLMFWTWLWGVPGALLSMPILMSAKVICERAPSLSIFCDLLHHDRGTDSSKRLTVRKK